MALTKIGTDGVKDDAITSGKIPANAVGSSELADNAVDTNAIQDDAVNFNKISHIDSGRILARVSGGLGQIETANASQVRTLLNVADGANQTLINNNADNRVITGSGTANTLEGEANLTYNGTRLNVGTGDLAVTGAEGGDAQLRLTADEGDDGGDYWRLESKASNNNFNLATYASGAWVDKVSVASSGRVGIGTNSPAENFHINAGNDNCIQRLQTSSYDSYIGTVNSSGSIGNGSVAGQLFLRGQNGIGFSANSGSASQVKITSNGLCFGTDTAAANALSDYEEGTWTPNIVNGWGILNATYDERVGLYVKIGKLVHVLLRIDLSGGQTNGNRIAISGFPFTQATIGSTGYVALNGYCDTASSNAQSIFCMVGRSGTTAEVFHRESTGESSFTGTELGNTGQMNFSGTYTTT